jgi:5-methylcytosine-specific restriction endonuclease McrA
MPVMWVTSEELLARQERAKRAKKRVRVLASPGPQRTCWVCTAPIRWAASESACSDRCRQLLWHESYRIDRIREESRRKGHRADITLEQWARAIRFFNGVCAYCDAPFDTADHIQPRHVGGPSTAANVIPACYACNIAKGAHQEPVTRLREGMETSLLPRLDHTLPFCLILFAVDATFRNSGPCREPGASAGGGS